MRDTFTLRKLYNSHAFTEKHNLVVGLSQELRVLYVFSICTQQRQQQGTMDLALASLSLQKGHFC